MAPVPINFKASYEIDGISVANESVLSFARKLDGLSMVLRGANQKCQKIKLDVFKAFSVNAKRAEWLRGLERGDLPDGTSLFKNGKRPHSDSDSDSVKRISINGFPPSLQNLYYEIREDFTESAIKALRLLRWRGRQRWHPQIRRSAELMWESADGVFRYCLDELKADMYLHAELQIGNGQGWDEVVSKSLDNGTDEPIGHQLLKNAQEIFLSEPRASISLAVAAMEIGVKRFVVAKVPETHWFALHAPTPPIKRIIAEYIPLLFPEMSVDEFSKVFPGKLREDYSHFIDFRNEIVHRGVPASRDDAKKCCDCVEQVLWRLDYLAGEKWAFYMVADNAPYIS